MKYFYMFKITNMAAVR